MLEKVHAVKVVSFSDTSCLHCRSLGDALRQWQANLSVTSDSAKPDNGAEPEGGADPAAEPQPQPGDPSRGEYEFMAADAGKAEGETQTLASATEDQAKALDSRDHPALPDQDNDEVMAAAEQEADEPMMDAAQHTGPDQVVKGNAAGSQAAAGIQEEAAADDATADSGAEAEDHDMPDADVARDWGDDSYVSAQLQKASLAEGGAEGLPDEDMVLAEGGLTRDAAEQLRKEVELRIKAASEGTLQLDTSAQAASYGQEVITKRDLTFSVVWSAELHVGHVQSCLDGSNAVSCTTYHYVYAASARLVLEGLFTVQVYCIAMPPCVQIPLLQCKYDSQSHSTLKLMGMAGMEQV